MTHFIRHYLEMVAAMFIGMGVLGMPAGMLVDDEALDLLVMTASMTVPMVAWMRYRGHAWRPIAEMSGAMFAPTFVAIALLGAVAFDTLMVLEHVAMLLAMLVAMLLRPDEYLHRPAIA